MGLNPRIVTQDRLISWDGVMQRLPKSQVIDVPPGSALERAIGAEFLVPLGAVAAQPPAEVPAEPEAKPAKEPSAREAVSAAEPPAAPPKPAAQAKKQDSGAAGDAKAGEP
jgi:predicted methyltransferase